MAGTIPNHALDTQSRVGQVIAILTVPCVLSTLVVVLRIYCRAVILGSFGKDDAVIIPAQVLTIATAVAIGLETKYGLGRHVWTLPHEAFVPYMKAFYSSIIVYNVGACLTKISIVLQYRRIFSHTALRKVTTIFLIFLTCMCITLCFLLPLVCVPVAAFWDPEVHGFCLNSEDIWYAIAGINVLTDLAVFALPLPVISSLRLPARQKAMLFVVFALGIFPCAVSIYRLTTLAAAARATDPTWDNINAATFSFLELSVAIIAVCLPTLRPVLVKVMPQLFGSLVRSTGHSGPGAGTGGRLSRAPYRVSSAAQASMFKGSALRESVSTEGLHILPGTLDRAEADIEFGDLDATGRNGPRRYSVSVVAGLDPEERDDSHYGSRRAIKTIKTTTVVTQKVSFSGVDEEGNRTATEKETV